VGQTMILKEMAICPFLTADGELQTGDTESGSAQATALHFRRRTVIYTVQRVKSASSSKRVQGFFPSRSWIQLRKSIQYHSSVRACITHPSFRYIRRALFLSPETRGGVNSAERTVGWQRCDGFNDTEVFAAWKLLFEVRLDRSCVLQFVPL